MNEQDSLFSMAVRGVDRDHALARFSDPATSQAADARLREREGKANEIRRGTHRHRALECFATRGPLIPEDVLYITGIDGVWKRVSDLKENKFIEKTGATRISRKGREADVYAITDAGMEAYAKLGSVNGVQGEPGTAGSKGLSRDAGSTRSSTTSFPRGFEHTEPR